MSNSNGVGSGTRSGSDDHAVSNTDIVLYVLAELGGAERAVHVEDVAEAAWLAIPARFSWPRHQKYPDLDSVAVTLRAAKKNSDLVAGSKGGGWMLTVAGNAHLEHCEDTVHAYLQQHGQAGRTDNRRERGGADSQSARRLQHLRGTTAMAKYRRGALEDEVTVHDFLGFYEINQYMPESKYQRNRQRVQNLVRDEPELRAVADELHDRYGASYRALLLQGGARRG